MASNLRGYFVPAQPGGPTTAQRILDVAPLVPDTQGLARDRSKGPLDPRSARMRITINLDHVMVASAARRRAPGPGSQRG